VGYQRTPSKDIWRTKCGDVGTTGERCDRPYLYEWVCDLYSAGSDLLRVEINSTKTMFMWFLANRIDGWLYGMRLTSVVCNVPVLSQNDSTYHHSVFTT